MSSPRLYLTALSLTLALACGGSSGGGATAPATAAPAPSPRPGGALDLMALVPGNAVVALNADLVTVRTSPRYVSLAEELAQELGLAEERVMLRGLLDRTDRAVGIFAPAPDGGRHEGMLLFTGQYTDADFDQIVAVAAGRHDGAPAEQRGTDGRRIVSLGNATLIAFDTWTWAIVEGPGLRAHAQSVALGGAPVLRQRLAEFGPRIGLPHGSAQAWAQQDTAVGADMVGLVFQGNNPQMVRNFVTTVRRHLAL